MTAFSSSCLPFSASPTHFLSSGFSLKPSSTGLLPFSHCNLSRNSEVTAYRRPLAIQASGDRGISSSAGIFVGGFVLGGIFAGTLGCIYAPQISEALSGADRKDLMRKLPKFIYDEEKALEKTRKILAEKIAQLNNSIDEVSAQLHPNDAPNGTAVSSDEIEASA